MAKTKQKCFQFPSLYNIDDMVNFKPMCVHTEAMSITQSWGRGRIVAVKFTKAKVFYDIVDDYYAKLFKDIDSCNVKNLKSK